MINMPLVSGSRGPIQSNQCIHCVDSTHWNGSWVLKNMIYVMLLGFVIFQSHTAMKSVIYFDTMSSSVHTLYSVITPKCYKGDTVLASMVITGPLVFIST